MKKFFVLESITKKLFIVLAESIKATKFTYLKIVAEFDDINDAAFFIEFHDMIPKLNESDLLKFIKIMVCRLSPEDQSELISVLEAREKMKFTNAGKHLRQKGLL